MASVLGILQFLNISAPKPKAPLVSDVASQLLDFLDSRPPLRDIAADPTVRQLIENMSKKCDSLNDPVVFVGCVTNLAGIYGAAGDLRTDFEQINRAIRVDPRIADPYYARGEIYFQLAVADIIRAGRFKFEGPLAVTFTTTTRTATLFNQVRADYSEADQHPSLADKGQSPLTAVGPSEIAYRNPESTDVIRAGRRGYLPGREARSPGRDHSLRSHLS